MNEDLWRSRLLNCKRSHDGFHHFPFNIQTQSERKDCVECGKTKEKIVYEFLNSKKKRKSGPPPPPGQFPKPEDPYFPKPE